MLSDHGLRWFSRFSGLGLSSFSVIVLYVLENISTTQ